MASSTNQESLIRALESIKKYKKKIIYIMDGECAVIVHSSYPTIDKKFEIYSGPITRSKTSCLETTSYFNRLKTFYNEGNEWTLDFITPRQMASAGFYYLGIEDHVKCTYCSQDIHDWLPGDDPFVRHKRSSPDCEFFTENQGYDVCGSNECPTKDLVKYNNELESILITLGAIRLTWTPRYKTFATLESRKKSFEICQLQMKQSIISLSEAGFFYAGSGLDDLTMCFYCGQGLEQWQDNDRPMSEHALWSPNCLYLWLNTDPKSIVKSRLLKKSKVSKNDPKALSKFVNDENNSTLISKSMIDSPINDFERQVRNKNNEMRKLQPLEIPDFLLCKICSQNEIQVVFMPCGHTTQCGQCALALGECCPMCRCSVSALMKIHVRQDNSNDENLDQLPSSSLQCDVSQPISHQNLCKVCKEAQMGVIFIPCGHIYACVNCSVKMHDCPVCLTAFLAMMPIYF